MSLGVRGANPIWNEVDLQGNLFDDTFYMFVLENTIPYQPAIVYHDPDLNVPWTNPIQFLGNGTLPIDIYFESDKVYRLEFRQGDTQQDPLIYEVDNYVAGTGGSTPIDTVAFASANQVTNPQFALISFDSPYELSATDPDPIQIGPGWYLELSGTGTVTITQVPLNDDNINPSNAPYALRLELNGWTTDSVFLRQRFEQNGMLWADKIVSSTITTRLEGSPQNIFAQLIDSNDSLLATVLPETAVNSSWNEFTGYGELPTTTNPDLPPSAYIDYKLFLPSNVDIYVSSFQLVVQEIPLEPTFEQDSINRQIDHTYNTAYPIVAVGSTIAFAGFSVPEHYFLCDGTAKSRTTYNLLFQALTVVEEVVLTNGSPTFTVVSSADYHIGMDIESDNIPAATTINNIVGNTITMSQNATETGPSDVRFFVWNNGDGSTTFNLPNTQGYVIAGANGTLFDAGLNGVGYTNSTANSVTLTGANLPAGTPFNATGSGADTISNAGSDINVPASNNNAYTQGSSTAFSIVQPTALMKICIRYE